MKQTLSASISFLVFSFLVISCSLKQPVDYVDPYIGNISHLLVPTYPTVHLPNSMLRVYPERADYTSDLLNGLPVAVTSHRGSSAFKLSPVSGIPDESVVQYDYDLEKITPYSYSVYLVGEDISVEYAPSHQSGIYSFRFGRQNNHLLLHTEDGRLSVKGNTISGYQTIDGTATRIYLFMETSQYPESAGTLADGNINRSVLEGETVCMDFGAEKTVFLRYGISFISEEQAERNLRREISTYDVEDVAREGRRIWNSELSKIKVWGGSEDDRKVFYTSLYRTYERMVCVSEDGRYFSPFDGKVHDDGGVPFYTDDWIWDTYRATHPLRILTDADKETDMINSYIRMAQQSPEGWMPTFPEITGDSHRMNGNHATIVIWDAYVKGLRGFDLNAAYKACKGALTEKTLLPWLKIPLTPLDSVYHKSGIYPALRNGESEICPEVHPFEKRQAVSVTLGDCYDSWCLSEIAGVLSETSDSVAFCLRSKNYSRIYNSGTGFFHPKDIDGNFIMPFDYRFSGGQGARDYYGENNGWIYRWDVPHDIDGLIDLMGGKDSFTENLDDTFREGLGRSKFEFYSQLPDHTGNVGQYSMANEPCLHIPYLYNYAGKPWMTQKRIRGLLDMWFRNDLMGVPGDEDGGGMSAFVVFSKMGFYPVTPGKPEYALGSPVFRKVRMKLSNGNTFTLKVNNYGSDHKYIHSASIGGEVLDMPFIRHEDIMSGKKLVLEMDARPDYEWGIGH